MNHQVTPEDIKYFRRLIELANPYDTATTADLLLAVEATADLLFVIGTMIQKGNPDLAQRLRDASCAAKLNSKPDERASEVTKALHLSRRTDQGGPAPTHDQLEDWGAIPELAKFLAHRLETAYRTARAEHPTTNHRARAVVHAIGLSRPPGNPHEGPAQQNELWRYAELMVERSLEHGLPKAGQLSRINELLLSVTPGPTESARWEEIRRTVRQADRLEPTPAHIMAEIEMFRSATTEHEESVAFHKANSPTPYSHAEPDNGTHLFNSRRLPALNNPKIFRVVAERLIAQGFYFTHGLDKMSAGGRRAVVNDIADRISDVFKNHKNMRAPEIKRSFRQMVRRKKRG